MLTLRLAWHVCSITIRGVIHAVLAAGRSLHDDRVISVGLDMFLQILRTFECLATEVATMWLQRNVNANVGSDVISFDDVDAALTPHALQVEVVGALATDVSFANMILHLMISHSCHFQMYVEVRRSDLQVTSNECGWIYLRRVARGFELASNNLAIGRRRDPGCPTRSAKTVAAFAARVDGHCSGLGQRRLLEERTWWTAKRQASQCE